MKDSSIFVTTSSRFWSDIKVFLLICLPSVVSSASGHAVRNLH